MTRVSSATKPSPFAEGIYAAMIHAKLEVACNCSLRTGNGNKSSLSAMFLDIKLLGEKEESESDLCPRALWTHDICWIYENVNALIYSDRVEISHAHKRDEWGLSDQVTILLQCETVVAFLRTRKT